MAMRFAVPIGALAVALLPQTAWSQANPSASPLRLEGGEWVETLHASLPAAAALRVETRGAIRIRGGETSRLAVQVRRRVRAASQAEARRLLDQCDFRAWRLGETVRVVAKAPALSRVTADVDIEGPRSLDRVQLETSSGSLDIANVAASLDAGTAGGPVRVDGVVGPVRVRTGGGEIEIGTIGTSVEATTGGGPIRVAKAGGMVTLQTGGGQIYVGESGPVRAITGAGNVVVMRAFGPVAARTNGGVIRVHEADGEVSAENAAGAIEVSSARGVQCQAAAGGIRLRGVSGQLRAVTALGSILAELLDGRPLSDSFISTDGGDITILLPSNLAVTVEAWNESPGRAQRIVSEFNEIRVQAPDVRTRYRTVATGALNGGGPLLRIAASDGTIYLRRK
ncbi:MAG: hypothetical protein R2762_01335 [Bryobacteraceae bacterium]